ncbi:hypothetical protein [Phenylobacterium montanum]|uniref:Chemotaxis protein CheE n=1 Tax=Phenylobacterium montanum TaxID=2823693 RepID=A0A975FVC8_9CAUL|nr:hypothetical protein [Caulobacter sp. S6]QUD85990.1 hypothetical protein KCG34_12820 [Caulobacter sp. S6]
MNQGHNIKVKNRLGEMMRQPGGRSVIEALKGAQKRLEKLSPDLLKSLDKAIARLDAGASALHDPPDEKALSEVYQASNEIIALAGLVGYAPIDEVAHGLCELIDAFLTEGQWNDQAIRVHIDSAQLLRTLPPTDKDARERVLDGLRKVWNRFGVRQPAPPPPQAEDAAK